MPFENQAVLTVTVSHDLGGSVERNVHLFRYDDLRIDARAAQKHFRLRSMKPIGRQELEGLKRYLAADHVLLKQGIVALGEEEPLVLCSGSGQPDIHPWQGGNCDLGTEYFAAVAIQ